MPGELATVNYNLVVAAVRRHARTGLTRNEIGEQTHLSYQTIDRVVAKACSDGVLEIEPLSGPDPRICPVSEKASL